MFVYITVVCGTSTQVTFNIINKQGPWKVMCFILTGQSNQPFVALWDQVWQTPTITNINETRLGWWWWRASVSVTEVDCSHHPTLGCIKLTTSLHGSTELHSRSGQRRSYLNSTSTRHCRHIQKTSLTVWLLYFSSKYLFCLPPCSQGMTRRVSGYNLQFKLWDMTQSV